MVKYIFFSNYDFVWQAFDDNFEISIGKCRLNDFLLGFLNREFRRLFVIGVWNLFEALFYCNWKFIFRGFIMFILDIMVL